MTYTRSASAIPLLLSTGELQHCKGGEVPVHHAGLDALRDPDATVVIDVSPAFSMIALVGLLVQDNPDSPEAAAAVPDFVRALRCGDERIRMMSGQAIGNVHRLSAANAAALRELLHHPRANTRALSATLLALSSDTVTIAALEKALADPDESVQLNAAHALAREHRSPKALPVLRRLTASKTGDIAQVARQALTEDEAASK
jgi:HEAT repeat protein